MTTILRFLKLTLVNLVALSALAHGVQRFDNGRWYDGTKFVQRTMWSVDGVFRDSFDGQPDAVIDLKGGWVIPPFGDAHHHDLDIRRFLSAGVFYVKNPNNLRSQVEPIRATFNLPESVDMIFANGGLTATGGHPGPLYERNGAREGDAYFAVDDAEDLAKTWAAVLAGKPDFIKIYLEKGGLDRDLATHVVRRAHAAGLTVSAHVTTADDFRAAIDAGVDEITHLPLERISEADAKRVAAAGIRVVTTTISHRDTSHVKDIDSVHRANIDLLRHNGVSVLLGTDDGRFAVAEAENLLRIGAFDVPALLRVWTVDTPRAIFPKRQIGCLSAGCEASFLALEGNPLDDFRAVRRIALAVKQGHVLKIERPKPSAADNDISESELNALGYAMLRHNAIEAAVDVFRANVARFPQSSNVYDSLGEAYMMLAIQNYQKSLDLNPKNTNAAEILRRLRASR